MTMNKADSFDDNLHAHTHCESNLAIKRGGEAGDTSPTSPHSGGSLTRRHFLNALAACVSAATLCCASVSASGQEAGNADAETQRVAKEWLRDWMSRQKAPVGMLHLSRFADETYFITKPIAWEPDPNRTDQKGYTRVEVPIGFVTDLASIPRVFWTLLRPDGDYVYAAIIHDYLYWTQSRSREESDTIFRFAMEDFKVRDSIITTIYQGVAKGGESSWRSNAALKRQGEKRILKKFPDDPRVRWPEWKQRGDVFE